jgi:type IV pilus assembly protein PilO
MKITDKQQVLILLAGVVMLTGFGGLRYVPVLRQKQALAARMEQQQQEMEEIRANSSLLPELRHQKGTLQDGLDQFVRKIPQGRDFARLWQQIADAMNTCGVRDPWVQPGTEIQTGCLSCIPLTIECKGSMSQIFAFIKAIEGLDRLIRMEDVKLENSADFDATIKMSAKVAVYYQPDEK